MILKEARRRSKLLIARNRRDLDPRLLTRVTHFRRGENFARSQRYVKFVKRRRKIRMALQRMSQNEVEDQAVEGDPRNKEDYRHKSPRLPKCGSSRLHHAGIFPRSLTSLRRESLARERCAPRAKSYPSLCLLRTCVQLRIVGCEVFLITLRR